jgi:hypothetical protein
MLVLPSPLDYRRFRHVILFSGPRDASFSTRYRRLARGEAALNNAGCGNDIVQTILVRIRDHEAFRTAFGPRDFEHCVSHFCNINRLFHSLTSLRRFRYRRPKLNHLAPLGQRDPLRLLVKSRRNIELDYSCHGEPPYEFSCDNGREAIQMPKV